MSLKMVLSDIFRKCNGIQSLEYGDFQPLGWSYNNYFRYLSFCEEIRSATIVGYYFFSGDMKNTGVGDKKKLIESLVPSRVKALFEWLGHFCKEPLPKPYGAFEWMRQSRTYNVHNSDKMNYLNCMAPSGEPIENMFGNNPEPGLLYTSFSHFRPWIELYIKKILLGEKLFWFDFSETVPTKEEFDELFSTKKLTAKELNEGIEEIDYKIKLMDGEPIFPKNVDRYFALTQWASQKARYNSLIEEREEYESMLDELFVPEYDSHKTVLYIYQWGNIICKKEKHDLVDVNCHIPSLEGTVVVNAQYCRDCKKFVISRTDYEQYMKQYKMIPVRFCYVDDDGNFPQSLYSSERADHSPLSLAGYSVSKASGFDDATRQKILISIIQNGVLKKHEVLDYLSMFINTNGMNMNMEAAVEKWKRDHRFLLAYNMENQENHHIERIEKYKKN